MTKEVQKQQLEEFQSKMKEILFKKSSDYSTKDALSNFKGTALATNQSPEMVALTLIGIKVSRLGVLLNQSEAPKNESIEDSLIDLANYTFLLKCILYDKIKIDDIVYVGHKYGDDAQKLGFENINKII